MKGSSALGWEMGINTGGAKGINTTVLVAKQCEATHRLGPWVTQTAGPVGSELGLIFCPFNSISADFFSANLYGEKDNGCFTHRTSLVFPLFLSKSFVLLMESRKEFYRWDSPS